MKFQRERFRLQIWSDVPVLLLATHAMGTRFELVLHGEDELRLRAVGEEAIREVELWHGRLSRFEPGSDTSRLNRDGAAPVDGEMRELLEFCERMRQESGGAFDVRVGPGGTFDFGAVGKGWALDRAAAVLREQGVECAMLHGGTSSVVAMGSPPGEVGWRVAIRSDGGLMEVMLRDRAMGVSAPRGRVDATGSGHIVDPRTGLPVSAADTVAVIVPLDVVHAGALSDAWSTALIVLGERARGMGSEFESHIHTHTGGWVSDCPATMDA